MVLSATTTQDLQVFNCAKHPSLLVTQTLKEDQSLFSLYDFTVSQPGKEYLKQMLSSPTLDYSEIKKRQQCTIVLCQAVDHSGQQILHDI